ncbi:MAG: NAD(P)/FAD-dependent oxidoreductase [Anaerolineae bacterium]|nr:NAD(P)/FAD-dependent oxidoreductase [Anaerolineae bacterium]
MFDVVIVGGSAAGLSAALILGRFKRRVLVCDTGKPRNARSQAVHGFFTRDGIVPHEMFQIAHDQLQPYATVEFRQQEAIDVNRTGDHFEVAFADGSQVEASYILLATGVKDELPPIKGLEPLWGRGVYHCPYCHGWEARSKPIAIFADLHQAEHLAALMYALSDDIVICTNGQPDAPSSEETIAKLAKIGIQVIPTAIAELKAPYEVLEGIVFEDGSYLPREAIFVATGQHQHSTLPAKLGCELTETGHVWIDSNGLTSVDGVYAAGDMTSPKQQVLYAAAQGAWSAAWINSLLAQRVFAAQ